MYFLGLFGLEKKDGFGIKLHLKVNLPFKKESKLNYD